MLRDDRRLKNRRKNGDCRHRSCPSPTNATSKPPVEIGASFLATLNAWRKLSTDDQNRQIVEGDSSFEPTSHADDGRLRVGLWCPCLGLGGAEVWQLSLARAVDSSRIAWTGAAVIEGRSASDPRMIRELVTIMPVGHGTAAARAIAARSDVIVSWAVTDVAAILDGLPVRPTIVMACHFPIDSPWGPGTEELLRPVDRFVAVSELAVDSTPPAIRDRVEVIWNAVDPARLEVRRDRVTVRSSWGVAPGSRVVGYLGRLSPEKDPEAMVRLGGELPEGWEVVIVGDGRERDRLRRLIEDQLLERVHLVGGDTAAGDVLNGFDSLIVPSLYESFGLTLAEGLWSGVPAIATSSGLARLVPGLVREIPLSVTGQDLREALLADLNDAGGTSQRAEQARSFARERLALERFGREWTELLLGSRIAGKGGHNGGLLRR